MSLNSEIKTIISTLSPSTLYLRAATLNEANVELPRIELLSPIAIHADLPTITNVQTPSQVIRTTSVNVMFLKKNTNQDDTGEEVDVIIDEMTILADQFFQTLGRNALLSPSEILETYDLETIAAYQFSDEVLTGVILTLEFPEVTPTYCP